MATSEKTLEDLSAASYGLSSSQEWRLYLITTSACLLVVGALLCGYDQYAHRLPEWLRIFGEPVQEKQGPASPQTIVDFLRWTALFVYLCWMFLKVSPRYIGRLPFQLQFIGCVPERLATLLHIKLIKADSAVTPRFDLFVLLLAFDAIIVLVTGLPESPWTPFMAVFVLSILLMNLTGAGGGATAGSTI